jgi:glycosyltransferase involved in cell wall biosynthesis
LFVANETNGEVILVDNGSSDATATVLKDLLGAAATPGSAGSVVWVQVEVNQGYGFGILSGLAHASGPIVGWTHADLQTDPADVIRGIDNFAPDGRPTLVKGKRFARPVSDNVFTAGMSAFESLLLGTRLRDINAQPTLFSRELMDTWGEPPHDFSLDLFAMYRAKKSGFTITRFPVLFVSRKWGESSWNTNFGAKWKFIKRTLSYSFDLRRRL